jgi:hypothetical protein
MARARVTKAFLDLAKTLVGKTPAELAPHVQKHGAAKLGPALRKAGEKGVGRKMKAAGQHILKGEAKAKKQAVKDAAKPIKTPTGTKYKRAAPKKEKSKAQLTSETQAARRKRKPMDEGGRGTTVVGEGVKGSRKKNPKFKSALHARRAAKKKHNETEAEFNSRMSKEARGGGVSDDSQGRGRGINEGPKDTGYAREQASDLMRGRGSAKKETLDKEAADIVKKAGIKDGSDVSGREISEARKEAAKKKTAKLKAKRLGNKKKTVKKSTGGRIRGAGKAQRGQGKALLRGSRV